MVAEERFNYLRSQKPFGALTTLGASKRAKEEADTTK